MYYCQFPLSQASIVEYMTITDLVNHSDYVIEGDVLTIHAVRSGKNIYSVLRLDRAQVTINGESTVLDYKPSVRFIGGNYVMKDEDNDTETTIIQKLTGMPEFSIGERVVLFLKNNGTAKIPFVGLSQGVIRVSKNGLVNDNAGTPITRIEAMSLLKSFLVLSTNGKNL